MAFEHVWMKANVGITFLSTDDTGFILTYTDNETFEDRLLEGQVQRGKLVIIRDEAMEGPKLGKDSYDQTVSLIRLLGL